jgi:predicted acylesterase/phospholipase RssA/CRP-like cAMP-binding protein
MPFDHLEDLLKGVDDETRRDIETELRPVALAAGETLFREGDPAEDVFFLRQGRLGVRRHTAEGTETEIDALEPGASVGEMALLTGEPRAATVEALQPCELVRLSGVAFGRLSAKHPRAMADYARTMLPRFQRTQLAGVLTRLFGSLDSAALAQLQDELEWQALSAGETLFRQGESGDALYVIVDGRLRVVADGEAGERTLRELGRGESVGEAALLTGDPRSATVYAVRDSHVVRLDAALFERVVERHPHALLQIARTTAHRTRPRGPRKDPGSRTFALVAVGPDAPLSEVASALADSLRAQGSTLHLGSARLDARRGKDGIAQTPEDHPMDVSLVAWLSQRESEHRYVVYEADRGWSAWSRRCVRQADRIVLVGRAGSDPEPGPLEIEVRAAAPRTRAELVLVHPDDTERPRGTAAWLERRSVEAHHHLRLGNPGDVARVGRCLAGRAIGLVFGGGGARGFAHIGVIRAIEESGLPVDAIGATSMGAIVGSALALEWPRAEMERLASLFVSRRRLLDPTLPLTSFMASGKVTRLYQRLWGDTRIEDLWRPLFIVSSNLSKAEPVIHRGGLLWECARATTAIPGTFSPMLLDGDVLVDGGVLNNLPIDVMRDVVETGTVVGVNVVPSQSRVRTGKSRYRFGPTLSGFRLLWNRVMPLGRKLRAPSLLGILTRSTEINSAWRARAEEFRRHADLLIEPALGRFRTLDFDAWEKIVGAGYESGGEQLRSWLAEQEAAGQPAPNGAATAR